MWGLPLPGWWCGRQVNVPSPGDRKPRATDRPPALTEAYQEVAKSDPDVAAWFQAGQGALPMPNIPAMNSVWGPLGQAGADVISQKTGPKARFDAAAQEITANIAKG